MSFGAFGAFGEAPFAGRAKRELCVYVRRRLEPAPSVGFEGFGGFWDDWGFRGFCK
jgi:hypothetical protein